jgi:FKBP12-rapamycin complex-associated protein
MFDFRGQPLHEFIRECAALYLENPQVEIRKAAALTCCQLLGRDPSCSQSSQYSLQIVSQVLDKIISIAIADPDSSTRLTVLSSLDEKFDRHLSQADCIKAIFVALNDEVFESREVALKIIGRLALVNPAFVLPSLRKLLIKLLTELEYAGIGRHREESAKLLGTLISNAPRLVLPYVETILKVLLPKARDPSPGVAAKVLTAIGELAFVGTLALLPFVDELMHVIMETLVDQSSQSKREAALKTLGNLASNTGWVMEPYLQYPMLLDIIIGILKTEQLGSMRRETVKVMGVLGALDPYRHKITSTREGIKTSQIDTFDFLAVSPSSDDYYPIIAINTLMTILRDGSLSVHHTAVVTAVMYIFKTLGLKCVTFLPNVVRFDIDYASDDINDENMSYKHARVLFATIGTVSCNCQATHTKFYSRTDRIDKRTLE